MPEGTFSHVVARLSYEGESRVVITTTAGSIFWIAKNAKLLHADDEDSDQITGMRRLICVLVRRKCQKVRFLTFRLI